MVDWEKMDPKDAAMTLGPEGVRRAQQHAAETVARSRTLLRARVKTGRIVVIRGPITPVPGHDGTPMPPSASPVGYMIMWYGNPGADWPSEIDNSVLMRVENPVKGQAWAVESAAEAVRIIKAAFGLDVRLPREEPKS